MLVIGFLISGYVFLPLVFVPYCVICALWKIMRILIASIIKVCLPFAINLYSVTWSWLCSECRLCWLRFSWSGVLIARSSKLALEKGMAKESKLLKSWVWGEVEGEVLSDTVWIIIMLIQIPDCGKENVYAIRFLMIINFEWYKIRTFCAYWNFTLDFLLILNGFRCFLIYRAILNWFRVMV